MRILKRFFFISLLVTAFSCSKEEKEISPENSDSQTVDLEENILDKGVNPSEIENLKIFSSSKSQISNEDFGVLDFKTLKNKIDWTESILKYDKDEIVFVAPLRTPKNYDRNLIIIKSPERTLRFLFTFPNPKDRDVFYISDFKGKLIKKVNLEINRHSFLDNKSSDSPCSETVYVSCSSGQHSFADGTAAGCTYWTNSAGSPPSVFTVNLPDCGGGSTGGGGGGGSTPPNDDDNDYPGTGSGGGPTLPPGDSDLDPLTRADCVQNIDCEDCNLTGDINNDCRVTYDELHFSSFLNQLNRAEKSLLRRNSDLYENIYTYLSQNNQSPQSHIFADNIIKTEINGNLISAFPFVKYPEGSNYATQFPKLTQYLKNQLPTISNNSFIISKIKIYTNLTDEQIKEHLTWGKGPTVKIEQLGEAYGVFKKETDPNSIYLDTDLVNLIENSTSGSTLADAFAFLIGVTILHEYVHYGDYNYNGDSWSYPQEEGLLFEEDVYGQTVWIKNAEIILENNN